MITDLNARARRLPTPGLISLASRPAIARQALVEARKAEGEGQHGEAAKNYHRALELLETISWKTSLLAPTRAAAEAGLARLDPIHPRAEIWRTDALAWLKHAATQDLDAADLADYALLLEAGDPIRVSLVEQAAVAPRPPVSLGASVGVDTLDPRTSWRLAWSAVREAPHVPRHHLLVAQLDGRADEDRSADYTIAAALFLATEDTQHAREAAVLAHQLDSANHVATVVLADILRLFGQAEDAIALLCPLRDALGPHSDLGATIIRTLARALELDGRRNDALEMLTVVLDRRDAISEDLVFAGGVLSAQGDFDRARAALDRALEIDPDELPVTYASVIHWLRGKQPDRAIAEVDHAIRRRPENPYLYVLLGYLSEHAGQAVALDEQVARAVELGMDTADAWSSVSFLSEDQGDLRSAANALGRALRVRSDDPELLARRGQILLELGEPETAAQMLRRAIKYRPHDAELHRHLAEALLAADRPEEALLVLNRAIKKLSDDSALLACRGQVFRRLADLRAAERDLRRSLEYELNPSWAAELFRVLRDLEDDQAAALVLAGYVNGIVGDLAADLWNAGDHTGALAVADVGLQQARALSAFERAQLLMIRGIGEWQSISRGDPEKSLRHAVAEFPDYALAHVV
jgi:tetratricopeptide (TPR) repeat protein